FANIRWVSGAANDDDALTCGGGNVYASAGADCTAPGHGASFRSPDPCHAPSDVISLWSNGAYDDLGVSNWDSGHHAIIFDFTPVDIEKTYKLLDFEDGELDPPYWAAMELTTPIDITGKTTLH